MNPDHIARLLWQEREGSLSRGERRELDEALRDRPELAAERERIVEVAERLAAVEAVEPPVELESLIDDWTADVAARASHEQRRAAVARTGIAGRRQSWGQRLTWAAMGAAAALLAMAVVTADFGVVRVDEQDVYGSMTDGAADQRIEAEGVALRLTRSGDRLEVEVDGAAGGERLDLVGDGLELESIELREGSLAEMAQDDAVLWVVAREASAYDIALRIGENAGTVALRVSREGEILIEREIRLGDAAVRGP